MARNLRGLVLLLFLQILCLVGAQISECTTVVESPTDCPGCCPLEESTITLTEWVTSTSKCFQTTVVTTTPTKLIRSTIVQGFVVTVTTTALFTVTTSFISTVTTTEFDTIFLPTTRTFTRTTTAIGSAVISTRLIISPTTTFTTTTSTLLDRATSTISTSRSTDLTITIPLTTTRTLVDTFISREVLDTIETILQMSVAIRTTFRAFRTVTSFSFLQSTSTSKVSRPEYLTLTFDEPQFFTDTIGTETFWTKTSTVFYIASTETNFGTTTQTYSRIYGF